MKSVYVVTRGVYSDYHIEAIFGTDEEAKAFVGDCHNADFSQDYDLYAIEKYELGGREKACKRMWERTINLHDGLEVGDAYESIDVVSLGWRGSGRISPFSGSGTAEGKSCISPEHALKLAVEARQAWMRAGKPQDFDLPDEVEE